MSIGHIPCRRVPPLDSSPSSCLLLCLPQVNQCQAATPGCVPGPRLAQEREVRLGERWPAVSALPAGRSERRCLCLLPRSEASSWCFSTIAMSGVVNFLDETEVKQYLDNLGIEYSYQCRKEKDPEGCQRLADYLDRIKKNYEAAAKILKHNCEENNHGESCYKLGSYYVSGKGGLQQNLKAAYECFVKSCEKGGKKSVDACHNAALLAHDGRIFDNKPDSVKARDYYIRACNGNFAASCFNLSTLYIQGAPGVTKDMAQALKYSLKACDLGHIWACANTSRMYKLGEGTSKDNEKAEHFKNRAQYLHKEQKEFSQQMKFGQ